MNYLNLKVGDQLPQGLQPKAEPVACGRALARDLRDEDAGLDWYLLRSATMREMVAERRLIEAGHVVYLPRKARWSRLSGQKRRIERPLVPGYLFIGVAGGAGAPYAAARIDGVHALVRLDAGRPPRAVALADFRRILDDELAGAWDDTIKPPLTEGRAVRITDGVYAGLYGEFVREGAAGKVNVLLRMLGKVHLDRAHIEALTDEEAALVEAGES